MEYIDRKMLNLIADSLTYKVGDEVYHKTSNDQTRGVVIDIEFPFLTGIPRYAVSFGPNNVSYLLTNEITFDKPIEY